MRSYTILYNPVIHVSLLCCASFIASLQLSCGFRSSLNKKKLKMRKDCCMKSRNLGPILLLSDMDFTVNTERRLSDFCPVRHVCTGKKKKIVTCSTFKKRKWTKKSCFYRTFLYTLNEDTAHTKKWKTAWSKPTPINQGFSFIEKKHLWTPSF